MFAAPSQPGSYATLGRPTSLPITKQTHHRSSSDPDLPGSNPSSPDAEVASLISKLSSKFSMYSSYFMKFKLAKHTAIK